MRLFVYITEIRNIVLNGRYIFIKPVINGIKEKETFCFEERRQVPGEFFSFYVPLFKLGKI